MPMIVRIIVPEEFGRHNRGRIQKIPSPRTPHGEYAVMFDVETFVIHQPLDGSPILIDCRVDTSGLDNPKDDVVMSEARRESRFESGGHGSGRKAPSTP